MMTHDRAIDFLKKNQPLPSDDMLEKDIEIFNEVRKFFLENPDSNCIPLFLNCFGDGSGFGVYQTIEDLLAEYDDSVVITHLKNALFSKFSGVRYWCAQMSARYESEELIDGLLNVYNKGDIDSKCAALAALSSYDDPKVIAIAEKALQDENDGDLLEIAGDILQKAQK